MTPKVEAPLTLRIASALFEIASNEPSRSPRIVLHAVCLLIGILIVWACVAKLDIVAVANGRLVPRTYVKIVQPAEAGIIREILVEEGQLVDQGQVLLRLDPTVNAVDSAAVGRELELERLQLRRIESELVGVPMAQEVEDDAALFVQIDVQRSSRRQAYLDMLAQETAARGRSLRELEASRELLEKLETTLPSYRQSAEAYEKLAAQHLIGELEAIERRRQAIETEQDLDAQRATVAALEAAVEQRDQRLAEIRSVYTSELARERVQTVTAINRLEQQLGRLQFQERLLELRAPQAGVVKDLATTTVGAVVQPGTVLVSLVPQDEPLRAEVLIENKDIGFVAVGQSVRIKLAAYQFQKYGMLEGVVRNVGADSSTDSEDLDRPLRGVDRLPSGPAFKAMIELNAQLLRASSLELPLAAGMQVSAEIMQGKRTVLEYLLSPVQRVVSEAGMER